MRILLDESTPRPLKREFVGFDVTHIADLGWQGRENGVLLEKVPAAGIAVVVLHAVTNRLVDLRPLIPATLAILDEATRGKVYRVGV